MIDASVETLLTETKTWAVVGCSPNPARDSNEIAALLQSWGFRVVPVNPRCAGQEILGERCYASLAEVPDDITVDVVDIFRRSELAGAHVDEAIARGVRGVWLQLGVIDDAAAARARAAGLDVVMDRCPAIEMPKIRPIERDLDVWRPAATGRPPTTSEATTPAGRLSPSP